MGLFGGGGGSGGGRGGDGRAIGLDEPGSDAGRSVDRGASSNSVSSVDACAGPRVLELYAGGACGRAGPADAGATACIDDAEIGDDLFNCVSPDAHIVGGS